MNKSLFKAVISHLNFPVLPSVVLRERGCFSGDEVRNMLQTERVILKPLSSGSSIGVQAVDCGRGFEEIARSTVDRFGETIVEPLLENFKEVSVAVHDFQGEAAALSVCELLTNGEIFDFSMKNGYHSISKKIPATLDQKLCCLISRIALDIYEFCGIDGVARVDMLIDKQERIFVLEVNTLPGLLPQSIVPAAFEYVGVGYDEMIEMILMAAFKKKRFFTRKILKNHLLMSDSVSM